MIIMLEMSEPAEMAGHLLPWALTALICVRSLNCPCYRPDSKCCKRSSVAFAKLCIIDRTIPGNTKRSPQTLGTMALQTELRLQVSEQQFETFIKLERELQRLEVAIELYNRIAEKFDRSDLQASPETQPWLRSQPAIGCYDSMSLLL